MSWLLKNKIIIVLFLLCGAIIFLFTRLWVLSLLIILTIGLFGLNKIILRKSNKMPLLSAQRKIKKYKYLVIGDLCPDSVLKDYIDKQEDAFKILAPGRSLNASYQILLHTISILDDGGTCIIVDSGKQSKKVYSIFDLPYLSLITRKELQIEPLVKKSFYPLFYEPLKSLRILFNKPSGSKYKCVTNKDNKIIEFCRYKGIRLIHLVLY